jgi:hypothetical protein
MQGKTKVLVAASVNAEEGGEDGWPVASGCDGGLLKWWRCLL